MQATANSVEGRMLDRAASKLKLEKLVITKGNFKQEEKEKPVSVQATEILDLIGASGSIRTEKAEGGEDIREKDLNKILDRRLALLVVLLAPLKCVILSCFRMQCYSDLEDNYKGPAYPREGTGFKVVEAEDGRGLLSGVE